MNSQHTFFHLFTVKPVAVERHERPRVQYGDYYVFAGSLQSAWETIRQWAGVEEAQAVWGVALEPDFQITPDTKLHQQDLSSQYQHWSNTQERYARLTPDVN